MDVGVDAAAVLESRAGGLQERDIEGWSGLMCYVGADRSLRSPPLGPPRGDPYGSRLKAGGQQILQTARTGDCRGQARPACARWGRDYRLWMTPR